MLRKLLIGGIGDVVALGPVADGGEIDVEETGDEVLAIAEDDSLLDVREELQLVLDVFRRDQRARRQLADILGPIDDLEVAIIEEEAGIAGAHEPSGVMVSAVFSASL